MCRDLDRRTGTGRSAESTVTLPVMSGVVDVGVRRNAQRCAGLTARNITAIAFPVMTCCAQKPMVRDEYALARLLIPDVAAIAFPGGAECPVECKRMCRYLQCVAGITIAKKAAIAFPAIIRQMSVAGDDDRDAFDIGPLKASVALPIVAECVQMSVCGHGYCHTCVSLFVIAILAAIPGIIMRVVVSCVRYQTPRAPDAYDEKASQ